MKFKRMFFMLAVIFLMISCSNDRDLESLNSVDLNKIQVVNISDYLSPSTRNMSTLKETAPYMSNNYRITVAFENFTSGCCSGVKKKLYFW